MLVVSCFAVAMKGSLGPARVGLAFSNVIQLLVFYAWLVRFVAEAVSLFCSVESVRRAGRSWAGGGPGWRVAYLV